MKVVKAPTYMTLDDIRNLQGVVQIVVLPQDVQNPYSLRRFEEKKNYIETSLQSLNKNFGASFLEANQVNLHDGTKLIVLRDNRWNIAVWKSYEVIDEIN